MEAGVGGQGQKMNALNILVVGESGSGKSTAARVISIALRRAGFQVELMDKDDVPEDQFDRRLEALRGTSVRITCGNATIRERPDDISERRFPR